MTEILAIGGYRPGDAAGYDAMGALKAADPNAALALPEAERAKVRAIGYMGHHPFGAAQMDEFPALELIANFGVGYDAIDVEAANARRVAVTNTPDVLNDDVADIAVALLLMQGRNMVAGDAHARSGAWAKEGPLPLNRKMSGGTVGILGLGRIGREIADRLAAFKMDIHYWSRSEKQTPGWSYHATPAQLANAVDFLIVATVGGPDTVGIVSAEVMEALGPKGVIVNISRGTTIDEGEMIARLSDGRLAGAGLDVFLEEPGFDMRLAKLGNVVLQPHQGSGTHETRAAMGQLQRDNISALIAGKPLLTQVNEF